MKKKKTKSNKMLIEGKILQAEKLRKKTREISILFLQ
jgi:hypothetical protein